MRRMAPVDPQCTGPGSTPHELDDMFRLRRSGIVTVALGVVWAYVEKRHRRVPFSPLHFAGNRSECSRSRDRTTFRTLPGPVDGALSHPPPGCDGYFPQSPRLRSTELFLASSSLTQSRTPACPAHA